MILFHPPAMSRDPFHQPRLLPAPSNLALSPAREGAATASLGSLGQGLTALMVKNFFLRSHLNLPSFSLKPSPLVSSPPALVPAPLQLSHSPSRPWQLLSGLPAAFSSQQSQLSQPFLPAEGFQPLDHLYLPFPWRIIHVLPRAPGSRPFPLSVAIARRWHHLRSPGRSANRGALNDPEQLPRCPRTNLSVSSQRGLGQLWTFCKGNGIKTPVLRECTR